MFAAAVVGVAVVFIVGLGGNMVLFVCFLLLFDVLVSCLCVVFVGFC